MERYTESACRSPVRRIKSAWNLYLPTQCSDWMPGLTVPGPVRLPQAYGWKFHSRIIDTEINSVLFPVHRDTDYSGLLIYNLLNYDIMGILNKEKDLIK